MRIKEEWEKRKIRESEEIVKKKWWFRILSIGLKKVLNGEETGEKAIDRIEKQMILIAISMIVSLTAPFVMFIADCSFVSFILSMMAMIVIAIIFGNFYILRIQLWRIVMIENDNFGQETVWLAGALANRFFRCLFRENREVKK